jgi:hypothetical protein
MTNFYQRLKSYYRDVAAVLRGEASAASIFPNPTDIGISRERVYAEFLRQHAPTKCNVFFGGFIFGVDGTESKQLDVIVTTDTTPKFDFHNRDGSGKSFAPIEGCLGAVSIKSTLNKAELEDALIGTASIPLTESLEQRVNPLVNIPNYNDWPYKVIYSSDGIAGVTLLSHLNDFYNKNPQIPFHRRPNLIHVSGKYLIVRATVGMSIRDAKKAEIITPQEGEFLLITRDPDIQGIVWTLDSLQKIATGSAHIIYDYGFLIDKINETQEKD